jgi:hypothetical protein
MLPPYYPGRILKTILVEAKKMFGPTRGIILLLDPEKSKSSAPLRVWMIYCLGAAAA